MGPCPSVLRVRECFTEFYCGPINMSDAERSGLSNEVAIPQAIENITDMMLADRILKVREILKAILTSHGSLVSILREHFSTRTRSIRWVPRLLPVDLRRNVMTNSKKCLTLFTAIRTSLCAIL